MARKTSAKAPKLGENIQGLSAKTICSSKVCGGRRHSLRTIKEPTSSRLFFRRRRWCATRHAIKSR